MDFAAAGASVVATGSSESRLKVTRTAFDESNVSSEKLDVRDHHAVNVWIGQFSSLDVLARKPNGDLISPSLDRGFRALSAVSK